MSDSEEDDDDETAREEIECDEEEREIQEDEEYQSACLDTTEIDGEPSHATTTTTDDDEEVEGETASASGSDGLSKKEFLRLRGQLKTTVPLSSVSKLSRFKYNATLKKAR